MQELCQPCGHPPSLSACCSCGPPFWAGQDANTPKWSSMCIIQSCKTPVLMPRTRSVFQCKFKQEECCNAWQKMNSSNRQVEQNTSQCLSPFMSQIGMPRGCFDDTKAHLLLESYASSESLQLLDSLSASCYLAAGLSAPAKIISLTEFLLNCMNPKEERLCKLKPRKSVNPAGLIWPEKLTTIDHLHFRSLVPVCGRKAICYPTCCFPQA